MLAAEVVSCHANPLVQVLQQKLQKARAEAKAMLKTDVANQEGMSGPQQQHKDMHAMPLSRKRARRSSARPPRDASRGPIRFHTSASCLLPARLFVNLSASTQPDRRDGVPGACESRGKPGRIAETIDIGDSYVAC